MAENKSLTVFLYDRCLFRSWHLFLVCLEVGWLGGGGGFTVLSYAEKKYFHMLRKKSK